MQLKFQSALGKLLLAFIIVFNIVMVLLFSAKIVMDSYITVKLGFVFLAIDAVFIFPMIFLTYYKFEDDYLLIHDYPIRKFKIKYTDIFNVEDGDFETKNKVNVGLSLDRVAIGYKKYLSDEPDDYVERYIFVSPKDMNLFLIRMSARLKQNKVDIEEQAKKVSLKQQEHALKKKLADEKRAKEAKEKEPEVIRISGNVKQTKFKTEEVSDESTAEVTEPEQETNE